METIPAVEHEPSVKVWVTREGWIYLVILLFVSAGALLRNINLLMLMTGIMIAPMLLSWRACLLMLRNLTVTRSLPSQLFAGMTVNAAWKATNLRRHFPTWHLVIHDQMRDETVGPKQSSNVRVMLPQIRAGESSYGTYQVRFPNRGSFLVGPAKVTTRFPFGLIAGRFEVPEQSRFHVAPALGRLTATWDRRLLSHASGSQAIKRQRGAQDEEFFGLRQWRSGDSRRHIHWRATAKYNYPVVKQFDSRSDRDFVLALDLWAPDAAGSLESELAERALSFASTVTTSLPSMVRGKVALALCGEETVVLCEICNPKFCSDIWRELAVARVANVTEIGRGLEKIAEQIPGGTPFYVLSTRPQSAARPPGSRRLAAIEPWIRWLQVDSSEFNDLIELPEMNHSGSTVEKERAHADG